MTDHLKKWKDLAATDPAALVATLARRDLPPWELSFAAEAAQVLPAAQEALLALLTHESPTVREGAIYGLSRRVLDVKVRARLEELATDDRSGAVRESAAEALE